MRPIPTNKFIKKHYIYKQNRKQNKQHIQFICWWLTTAPGDWTTLLLHGHCLQRQNKYETKLHKMSGFHAMTFTRCGEEIILDELVIWTV